MKDVNELKLIEILLVEDNPGDIRLTEETLKEGGFNNNLSVVMDGEEAMSFLRREGKYSNVTRPDIILLDLNMPGKNGHEVLAEIKSDEKLKRIPVVVLTTSEDDKDFLKTYNLHVNYYINKPVDHNQLIEVVRCIEDFWLEE